MTSKKYLQFLSIILLCLYFWHYVVTYTEWHFIDTVNLIFHEAGHSIFFFLGQFVQVLMGSGFQILLPLAIALYFFFCGQRISGSLVLLWVGQNMMNVSIYAGDAIAMQLPLLGGDSVIHDWHYLLSALGILQYTPVVAQVLYISGILVVALGSMLAVYFVFAQDSGQSESFAR